MILEPDERARFIEYCRQQVVSITAILGQMEKLNLPEAVKRRQKIMKYGYEIVLEDLLLVTTEQIGK